MPKGTDKQMKACGSDAVLHIHIPYIVPLFILRIWQFCSANWDPEIWGSTTAIIWCSATALQEGSYTPRPTTGCFSINKDFLLSTEVPTDAFIGAKFTLCTRRELPSAVQREVEAAMELFHVWADCWLLKTKSSSLSKDYSAHWPLQVTGSIFEFKWLAGYIKM